VAHTSELIGLNQDHLVERQLVSGFDADARGRQIEAAAADSAHRASAILPGKKYRKIDLITFRARLRHIEYLAVAGGFK
jgi:hypothetical protein